MSQKLRRSEVTIRQFAVWCFERDRDIGQFSDQATFDGLPEPDRDVYLDEAKEYVDGSLRNNWPLDILNKIQE